MKPSLLVIGNTALDLIKTDSIVQSRAAGCAVNSAFAAAAFPVDVHICGPIGTDLNANNFITDFKHKNSTQGHALVQEHFISIKGPHGKVFYNILGQNHTPLSCRPGVNALFTRACLPKFKKDFSGIIVSGSAFMPGLNDCDFTDYLEQAKKNNPSLVIGVSIGGQGPGSKNFIRFSGLADIMVLNHHEALELFKYDFTLFDPEKFEKKGFFERKSRLKKIIPGFTLPSVFIITLADKGCLCIYRDKNKKTSALKLNNTEPFYYTAGTICRANQNTGFIGAGDKFFGALAAQILLSPQKIDEFSGAELKSIIKETMSHIIY